MEQQIFLPAKINFNLCQPKSTKPTIIYAVAFFKGRQYKINIGAKVIPAQWDKRKQCAIVSNCLSKLENKNNSIANEKINKILFGFSSFLQYVCNNLNEEGDFYVELKKYVNREMQTRKKTKRISFEAELKSLVYEMSSERQNKYKRLADDIIAYMKDNSIELSWDSITRDLLYQFFCHIAKKKPLQIRTFNDKVDNIYFLLNHADEHEYLTKYDKRKWSKVIGKIKENRNDEERQSVYIALTEKQVGQMASQDFGTPLKNEVRDIFVFLCLTGLSEGDLIKIWDEDCITWENESTIKYYRNKNGLPAFISLKNSSAKRIYDKFKDGFTETKLKGHKDARGNVKLTANECGRLNTILHQIIKETSFDTEIPVVRSFVDCRDGKIVLNKRKEVRLLSEEITIYDSRHTFITISYYGDMPKELIKTIVGHTSDAMIDKFYLKFDKDKEEHKKLQAITAHYNKSLSCKEEKMQQSVVPVVHNDILLNEYEKKTIQCHELTKQLDEANVKCKSMEKQVRQLQEYEDIFGIDEYTDKISELALQTEQDEIFLYHEHP